MSEIKSNKSNAVINWLKNTFMPMTKKEIPMTISLGAMMGSIVCLYTILRQAKDQLILGLGGASVIPYAKVLVMIVAAILGVQHSKITRKYSHKKAFLISIIPFIVFFVMFAFLFRYADTLQMRPDTIADLTEKIPFLRYFFLVIGNWMATSYYIFAEMFGSFILGVSFWQLVNFYYSHSQAKRIYTYFGLWAQIGNYLAGHIMVHISTIFKETRDINNHVFLVTSAVVFSASIILASLFYFFNIALKDYNGENKEKVSTVNTAQKAKVKMHWKESWKQLRDQPALLLTAFLSVWYGLCSTSMEVYWKDKVVDYYGVHGYGIFMGHYQKYTAIISFIMVLIGGVLMRNLPWIVPALFTPLVVIISSSFLFGIKLPFVKVILGKILVFSPAALQDEMLYITVIIGAAALIVFKAFKYTLFDPTKEMFTRSRTRDEAIQIKSLETFVSRFGKGGSSVIQTIILGMNGMTMDTMSPILWCMIMCMSSIWTYSIVVPLNKEMKLVELKAKDQEKIE